ncbi:cobalamin biosynthesis protein [Pseudomonas sp. SWRI18]|uniref:cobalamin biosynthesis protein n=1 Tax=Pseudomonas sp. SWRI18 TaxID=2753888 RepID=UPI0016448A30|nr:cobalamin biosynthesis protein [Pseudomonas sp. SWRI18]MBC3302653.1 cobalamin biosynthesis protein [Pseudomonas sp. SWRI18]
MTLVVGLGCQRGCDVHALLALFDGALAEGGIERQQVTALASIDRRQDEPGLIALARLLKLPLRCFSAEQLAFYKDRLSHKSDVAFAHTGCYGVAESAALALAEDLSNAPAYLRITRKKAAQATFALAWTG